MLIITICWLISVIFTWQLSRPNSLIWVLDRPNERSLHSVATPRTGGVAILIALICGYVVANFKFNFPQYPIGWIAISTLFLGLISLWEDIYGLSTTLRLLFQAIAALLLIIAELSVSTLHIGAWQLPLTTWLNWSFTLLFIMWLTNLYNFMDGIDGVAGGMAAIGFGTLAAIGWQHNVQDFFLINGMIAAAASGFLVWNFPPARIFMGDSGSITLGFLSAAMGLWGNHNKILELWMTILIFSPFIFDATVTLLRRLVAQEKIWQPHRTHYYQRLARILGHSYTTLFMYFLMVACSMTALAANNLPVSTHPWLILLWMMSYGIIAWYVELWLHKHQLDKLTL